MNLILFLLFVHIPGMGTTWTFRSGTSRAEIHALMINQNPSDLSLSRRQLEQSRPRGPHPAAREFEKLQSDFLTLPHDQLSPLFEKFIQDRQRDSLDDTTRRMVHYAQLRLAQLAANETESNHWLRQALIWAPDLTPDSQAFDPEFISRFRSLRTSMRGTTLDLARIFPWAAIVVWNGQIRTIKEGELSEIFEGEHILEIYSDTHFPIRFRGSLDQVLRISAPAAVAFGPCESARVSPLAKQTWPDLEILTNSDCEKPRATALTSLDLSPSLMEKQDFSLPKSKELQSQDAWWRSRWLWIGLGTAAASWMVYQNLRDKEPIEPMPTTRSSQ